MTAQGVLLKEYKSLTKEKWVDIEFEEENIYKWNLALMVINPDSMYYGGYFKAEMTFPQDYPYKPPDFRFTQPLWHPNIYPDGRLCISILHAPGEDIMSGESSGERWSPAQRVESVLISILSLLDDPEINSPANVDASVMFRDHKDEFLKRVQKDVEASKKNVPEGFIMPTHESTKPVIPKVDDDDFWADSDAEGDFGDFDDEDVMNGSDTDGNNDFGDFDDEDGLNESDSDEALNHDEGDDEIDEGEERAAKRAKADPSPDKLDSEMTEPDHD